MKKILSPAKITLAVITAIGIISLWFLTAPAPYHVIAGARTFGAVPPAIQQQDLGDIIREKGVTVDVPLPGHDEIFPIPGTDEVLVSARDEWIWRVNVKTGDYERFAFSPVSPTGVRADPRNPDYLYFCMARLDYHQYEQSPGLYRLNLKSRQFEPVVTRVPLTGIMLTSGLELPNTQVGNTEIVYPTPAKLSTANALNDSNSRPLQFCNDLDVSRDGRHIYISEPFSHPQASSGLGAMPEGITLARNGRVWRYDTSTGQIGLVVENIVFADGVLIEYDNDGRESGLIISETVNFRIGRAHLSGVTAGRYDVLWDNLPGLPDGLDRDSEGRVWTALIKDRTALMTWMHKNPWIKPLLLRIPPQWLPKSRGTAIVAFSPDMSRIDYYSHHDGSRLLDISVVSPGHQRLYLPSFFAGNQGLHYLPAESLPALSATH